MSFIGSCIAQAVVLNNQDGRLAAVQAAVATKLEQADYNAKIALVDAKDGEQDQRLSALESGKVAQETYVARLAAVDAKDAEQDERLLAVEGVAASKVAQAAYDVKMAALDAKDSAQDARLSALESDIAGRVESEINAKVAKVTFDSLATELRDADSALTAALATKVAATTQAAVDQAQSDLIAQKASINQVNAAVANMTNAMTALDAAKVAKTDYNAKVAALEEFIKLLLKTYTITLPSGAAYSYTGSFQNALLAGFQPENPVNLAYNSNVRVLSFSLPNTAANLSFVDIQVNGQWVQRWNPTLTAANRSYYSISGSIISVDLGAFQPSGTITVYTRYDVYTGSTAAGTAQLTL